MPIDKDLTVALKVRIIDILTLQTLSLPSNTYVPSYLLSTCISSSGDHVLLYTITLIILLKLAIRCKITPISYNLGLLLGHHVTVRMNLNLLTWWEIRVMTICDDEREVIIITLLVHVVLKAVK